MDISVGGNPAQVAESDSVMFTSSTPLPGLERVMAEPASRKALIAVSGTKCQQASAYLRENPLEARG